MKKILIIDDDRLLRTNLLEILGFEGYEGFGAQDGHEGILSARELMPDLILCDISLPDLDGFGVIAELRKDPQTAGIPVIFLSAGSEQDLNQRVLQVGAAAYLAKPYVLTDLLTTIRAQIGD